MFEPLSNIPDGLRYYFGSEARLRRTIEDTAMDVFDGWSYEEITTPSIDYSALFERSMGNEHGQRTFRFTDRDGRLLALRPDVTSLVARAAATLFNDRPRPLRLCYIAPVFRQIPRSHAEWRRESVQLGCELIGSGGAMAEMEMLAIAVEILERVNLGGHYRITLNTVEVFNGVAQHLQLDDAQRERIRHLIDVRDSAELCRFLASLNVAQPECDAFSRLTRMTGQREILEDARRTITHPRSVAALNELEDLWQIIETKGLANTFEIDLGDVSGLDYYTGVTFKVYVEGAGARIGSGGRYDGLISNFGSSEPAVGFVLDLDAMTDVLAKGVKPVSGLQVSGFRLKALSNLKPSTFQPQTSNLKPETPSLKPETFNLKPDYPLTIAIAKGRMQVEAIDLLARAGVSASDAMINSRRLAIDDESGEYRFVFVKPADVPVYVEHGIADCGIVGRDVLLESGSDLLQPLDLGISRCRIVVAACKNQFKANLGALRVATKYPRIEASHFGARGIPVEIIELSGSVELAPGLGLADCIVDLVETGRTLSENGLEVVDVVAESMGRVVVNRASYQLKAVRLLELLETLGQVVNTGDRS